METIGGSVQLMFFIYTMAAVISLAMAWIIKLIFLAIQMQKGSDATRQSVKSGPSAKPANATSKRTT